MSDQIDLYLHGSLKRWTSSQRPPKNARARLLLQAAAPYHHPVEGIGEELPLEAPRLPAIYTGYPHHDLSGMMDLLWAARLPLPSVHVQT
jgi:hypothetical protein